MILSSDAGSLAHNFLALVPKAQKARTTRYACNIFRSSPLFRAQFKQEVLYQISQSGMTVVDFRNTIASLKLQHRHSRDRSGNCSTHGGVGESLLVHVHIVGRGRDALRYGEIKM